MTGKNGQESLDKILQDLDLLKDFLNRSSTHLDTAPLVRIIENVKQEASDLVQEEAQVFDFKEFKLDVVKRELRTDEEEYKLTEKEFNILFPLCQKPNSVVDIGKRSSSTNTHLSNLKRKVPILKRTLQSRHGQGLYLSVSLV